MLACGRLILLVLLVLTAVPMAAQEVEIDAKNQPLADLLEELNKSYGIEFSYGEKKLEACIVSLSGTYPNPESAISEIVEPCNLSWKLIDGVFVIYRGEDDAEEPEQPAWFTFQGQVVDLATGEPLPFATVYLNDKGLVSDLNGNFAFKTRDQSLQLRVDYVGYHSLDTLLPYRPNQTFSLTPNTMSLEPVVVEAPRLSIAPIVQYRSGMVKINQQVATFLPGDNNNTMFNLLRLLPGVMAAGEQSREYVTWGSYPGQTQTVFDGITLFSSGSRSENIGAVNPLIIKDIEVFNGGYGADMGDRVGGLVKLTGRAGMRGALRGELMLNNQMASGLLNVPVTPATTLQIAFRKSYFNDLGQPERTRSSRLDPEGTFGDLNLRLSGKTQGGDAWYVSLLGGIENLQELIFERDAKKFYYQSNITSQQVGGTFFYSKKWKKGSRTHLQMAYSHLNSSFENLLIERARNPDEEQIFNNGITDNRISELSLKINHIFPSKNSHSLKIGGAIIRNVGFFQRDSSRLTFRSLQQKLDRLDFFVQDQIRISRRFRIYPGIKLAVPLANVDPGFQPRIRAEYVLAKNLVLDAAFGVYKQYIAENAIVDQFNNYLYFWTVKRGRAQPVLTGNHSLAGLRYQYRGFEFKLVAYYKSVLGLSRFVAGPGQAELDIATGNSRTYGFDLFLKQRIKKHELWVSYTLSKTEERFEYFKDGGWRRAPQDQRHEVKFAGIFNLFPVFLSFNYVFGSGFPNTSLPVPEDRIPIYSRLDVAFQYRLPQPKFDLSFGISVVNVFDQKNYRLNNFSNFRDTRVLYVWATPFTPLVFVNLGL